MDLSVKARIGAARILLEEHAGTASHQDVSFIQARALVEVEMVVVLVDVEVVVVLLVVVLVYVAWVAWVA